MSRRSLPPEAGSSPAISMGRRQAFPFEQNALALES
jgi:hypothetical protein